MTRYLKYSLSILIFLQLSGIAAGQSFYVSLAAVDEGPVCKGDSIQARVTFFGGSSPYTIEISNSEGLYRTFKDISSNFSFYIVPESDDRYYISAAYDRRDRKGKAVGEVVAKIYEETPVYIILEKTAYLESDPPVELISSPEGGIFSGPGVTDNIFDPHSATLEGSPHRITCSYTNENGCLSTDSIDIYVLSGISEVVLLAGNEPVENICGTSSSYLIRGSNEDMMMGSFSLFISGTDTLVQGSITDEDPGDNEAILDPEGLVGSYTLVYTYGAHGLEVKASYEFHVHELNLNGIADLPDTVCKYDAPFLLLPEVDPPDPEASFQFSGPGVSGNQEDGFLFSPGDAGVVPGNILLALNFVSSAGCNSFIESNVYVGADPGVGFELLDQCIEPGGSSISFRNLTLDKERVKNWLWDFGDPASGADNSSALEEPGHFYSLPGNKNIRLTATTHAGCLYNYDIDTLLIDVPKVDMRWTMDCFLEDQPMEFLPIASSEYSELDTLLWLFQTEDGDVLDLKGQYPPGEPFYYMFPGPGKYEISLMAENLALCSKVTSKNLNLRPLFSLSTDGYLETFDSGLQGWEPGADTGSFSWKRDIPDFDGFPQQENDLAWYTDLSPYSDGVPEQSWVTSPCFDLSGMNAPAVKLDLIRSFSPGEGGAVLQYSEPDENIWKTLGSYGSGENWYNDSTILLEPGGSRLGWSLPEFIPDSQWVHAMHPLEEVGSASILKFRVAFASPGRKEQLSGKWNQGFGFDNFSLRERSLRKSVLEYFTNMSGPTIYAADSAVNQYALEHSGDLYDLHYHMNTPMPDPIYEYNPGPPTTRSVYYGIPSVPYAILNGGVTGEYRFDLSINPVLEEQPLAKSSGEKPLFGVSVHADFYQDHLEGRVSVTCLENSYDSYLQLYTVIIEKKVTSFPQLAPDSSFRNVVMDILPSSAGKLLGDAWTRGQKTDYDFSWPYATYVEDIEDLSVVAFIQDRSNGWILQAGSSSYKFGVGISPGKRIESIFRLFPNPSDGMVYVRFNEPPKRPGMFSVTDLSGRELIRQSTESDQPYYPLDISDLPRGLFLVSWIEDPGGIRGIEKLIRE